jgi:release factor glutamine methyltransferase
VAGTVADLRHEIAALLASTSPTAALDARLLVANAIGCTPNEVLLRDDKVAGAVATFRAQTLARRRIAGEPIARIVGDKEFYGLNLALSPETLIPRPDTETLVDAVLVVVDRDSAVTVLDLGTGSGAILLALLSQLPNARGLGLDISENAVVTARANARRHGLSDRAEFAVGDWTDGIVTRFDVIVSNPPYIATSEIPGLPIEVRDHDPHVALDGGIDGLDAMRIIVSDLDRVLADGGAAFVEIGFGQGPVLATLAQASGFVCSFGRDIAAIERVAILSRQDGHLGASG